MMPVGLKSALLGVAAVCVAISAYAQQGAANSGLPQRDPTMPPPGLGVDVAGDESTSPLPLRVSGSNVVMREGKSYLVVGSRLVAPGQTVETYKLERITETEIWLRDSSGLTKVPRFAGVQRQVSQPACAVPKTPQPAKSTKPKKPGSAQKKNAVPSAPQTRDNEPHDC